MDRAPGISCAGNGVIVSAGLVPTPIQGIRTVLCKARVEIMKVKTRLFVCAVVPLLLAGCICFGAFRLYDTMTRATEDQQAAGRLVEKGLELKRAAGDMLSDPNEDSRRLWTGKMGRVTRDINNLGGIGTKDDFVIAGLVGSLREINRSFKTLEPNLQDGLVSTASAEGHDLLFRTDALIANASMLMDVREAEIGDILKMLFVWLALMIVVLPGMLSITAILASRRISQGITLLGEGTRRIAAGDLSHRVDMESADELGELAASFNKMSDDLQESHEALEQECIAHKKKAEDLRISNEKLGAAMDKLKCAQSQSIQQERLLVLKQISSGMMRDLNEALTPIIGVTEMLKSDDDPTRDPEELRDYFTMVHDSAIRATRVIKQLAEFFSPHEKVRKQAVDLRKVVGKAIFLTRPMWKEQMEAENIRVNIVEKRENISAIEGDHDSLVEAVTNLIINAVEAMPRGGELTFSTEMDGEDVVLTVLDSGGGMDEKTRQYCSEPFVTTKKESAGIGLTVVTGTVQRHNGSIDFSSATSGVGTKVSMRFPSVEGYAIEEAPVHVASEKLPKLRLLAIDDDADVSLVMCKMLERNGHDVTSASSGTEGIQKFCEGAFDVVLTDRAMPDMSGDEVAKRVKELQPDISVLMVTGFGSMMKDQGQHPEFVDKILNKPYTKEELIGAISELLSLSGAGAH
jgi:signal transduction histidine kinase